MSMIQVGRLGKLHGVQGAFRLQMEEEGFLECLLETPVVFLEKNGQKLPFFIDQIQENGPHLLIFFEEIEDREAGLPYVNCALFLRETDIPDDFFRDQGLTYGFLVGFTFVDQTSGFEGTVTAVEDYPQQEIAVVEKEGEEWLVPLNEQLFDTIDRNTKRVTMNLPSGLFEK